MLAPRIYIALVPLLYSTALILPLFFVTFHHQGLTTALFLVSFYWALASIFWPRLEPRHLLWTIPALLIAYPILYFIPFYHLAAAITEPALARLEYAARLNEDFLMAVVFQSFAALVASAGLTFQKKRARLRLRRAAMDEEEMMTLFEIKQAARPNEAVSFYKYKVLLQKGFCLVAEQNSRVLGAVHWLQIRDTLYVFDLVTRADTDPLLPRQLLAGLFQRGEMRPVPGTRWFFWDEAPGLARDLERRGFRSLEPGDGRLADAWTLLGGGLGPSLPSEVPLGHPSAIWWLEHPRHQQGAKNPQ